MKRLLALATLLLLGSTVLRAQTAQAPQGPPQQNPPASAVSSGEKKIDPVKEADIRKLLEVTGTMAMIEQTMQEMEKSIKPLMAKALPAGEYRDKLVDLFFEKFHAKLDLQKLVDLAVPMYDRHFSDEEIKGLIAFYQTPIGQKALKAMPQLTAELMQAGNKMGEDLGRESMMEVLAEHPELEKAMEEAQGQNR
jgi:uncharacterized protein